MLSCVLPVNSNFLTLLFRLKYYYHNTYWLKSVALIPPSVTTLDPTLDGIRSREQPSGIGGYFESIAAEISSGP
ncbi:hypothetical protein HanRHA438_Chr13g0594361 [Helianthus annuus]|nr:hypothetical protein HanRHA438_Chr13g0594361 [Helianthus annuus]